MCRIAGIINPKQDLAQIKTDVIAMCKVMAHGGPDDEGFYENLASNLVLGHRRLALIDLSKAGHQPMGYNDRLTISFNGEIYNYLILKKELQELGFKFHTNSDTEVILAGFACWGTAVFEKLRGMFAFALYDDNQKLTFLVRDSAGIKPLYYTTIDEQLIFASEVKAFKNIAHQFPENPNWKIYFLAFGHIPEPYTTLQDVFMLSKSHYLVWNHQSNHKEIKSFGQPNQTLKITNKNTSETLIREALENSVDKHLIADAPIGVFLSGGIDSSLLTLIAAKLQTETQQKLHTISINFTEEKFSEKIYQDTVLAQVKSEHADYTLDEITFNKYLPNAIMAMDQPTNDGINSWFVNFYAKENGLKAVLSGIGADELFGGYPSFKRMAMVNLLSILPNAILKKFIKSKRQAIKRSYYLSYQNTIGKYLCLRGFFTPDEIAKLLHISVKQVDETLAQMSSSPIPENLQSEEQASWLELNLYMQNQLLKDTDSMSMQHGVEVRVPFLDQDLTTLVSNIANHHKYKTKKPKGLLIDSFIHLLPRKIWDRPKMGFTFPFQYWLKENEFFLAGLAKINTKKGNQLATDFKNGKLHWSKAMALYQVYNTK